MRCGDLRLRIQDILEMSVRFDGDTKKSTFERLLQAETLNTEKNKSYYQLYDVKGLRAFHKQAMIKQQIHDSMLARRSGMDYSQGIQFEISIINMEEAQELTMNNQLKKSNRSGAGVAPSSTHGLPQRIALWDLQLERPKNRPWDGNI